MVSSSPFLKALLYADIFNFPLTKEELWLYAIGKTVTKKEFSEFITNPPPIVTYKDTYYFLTGKDHLITLREKRFLASNKKLQRALAGAKLIGTIPSVKFIGISGGLSLLNADVSDDIDFFIIVKKNSLFVSRLYITLLLSFFGMRRERKDNLVSDKICVNMFLEESALALPKNRHDLYTAHEIVQLVPLINKDKTYESFMKENTFVSNFLPNANKKNQDDLIQKTKEYSLLPSNILLEKLAKMAELWYMNRHKTTEDVTNTMLAFHPTDYRGKTLRAFEERLKL